MAAQIGMILTVNSLIKDMVYKTYDLNVFPLPTELETVLGLNMLTLHRDQYRLEVETPGV